ncbi:DUF1285 domain-containing protein [Lutibaculum baratangense]|uniref:Proteophosphoglycan n=1 Tax=Lutibaculum baratangense AMV1 TaxID=631454 RepID=V4RIQ8_9HYPH|nr:DUF1285 domain-containing protein [Lutibaculum baratangense]ESR23160.1 Proteophosphoglycan precursor [Lutibaculum baratangense AMV1]
MTGRNDTHAAPDRGSTPGGLAALEAAAREAGRRGAPPVERWNPDYCGDLDIRIAADGSWHYLGTPIGRQRLVRLFASVLRRDEDGRTYLVTPVEKIGITVDDAPFLAVEMAVEGEGKAQSVSFRTNVDDVVTVSADHPLRFVAEPGTGGIKPYVLVRGRLEALVTRALLYDLAELAVEAEGHGGPGIWSEGAFFPMRGAVA